MSIATAAQALIGPAVRVTRDHGRRLDSTLAPMVVVTIHPSAILRSKERSTREAAMAGFVADLKIAAGV